MSVLVNKRKDGKMMVLIKAKELAIHSLLSVQNEKYFPKRHRFTVINKIVDYSFDIFVNLSMAYELNSKEELEDKIKLLRKSLLLCKVLSSLLDVCKESFCIPSSKIVYWIGLSLEVKNLIFSWYTKELRKMK